MESFKNHLLFFLTSPKLLSMETFSLLDTQTRWELELLILFEHVGKRVREGMVADFTVAGLGFCEP